MAEEKGHKTPDDTALGGYHDEPMDQFFEGGTTPRISRAWAIRKEDGDDPIHHPTQYSPKQVKPRVARGWANREGQMDLAKIRDLRKRQSLRKLSPEEDAELKTLEDKYAEALEELTQETFGGDKPTRPPSVDREESAQEIQSSLKDMIILPPGQVKQDEVPEAEESKELETKLPESMTAVDEQLAKDGMIDEEDVGKVVTETQKEKEERIAKERSGKIEKP